MSNFTATDLENFLSHYDSEKHKMFANVYVQSLHKHKDGCIKAINCKDIDLLKHEMHDFKSLGRTVGYEELANLAVAIELDIQNDNHSAAWKKASDTLPMLDYLSQLFQVHL